MSAGFDFHVGGAPTPGFTVKSMNGCRIVYGPVPASEFVMLTHGFSKEALMATDLADRMGASFVIGEPDDLECLRKLDLPVSDKRTRDYLAACQLGLPDVAQWLRLGERGSSSNAMCKRMFGIPADAGASHPFDPDDLRRCLAFLDATKAHNKVRMMADVSPAWGRMTAVWTQLVATFLEESRDGKSAPKTYALMQKLDERKTT